MNGYNVFVFINHENWGYVGAVLRYFAYLVVLATETVE